MRSVFVDTSYLVALTNPKDQWHARAREVQREIGVVRLIITEFVLTEALNYFAASRPELRRAAARLIHKFENNPNVEVIPCTHEAFASGLALYEARLDKGYSLTDCISMNVMREHGARDALTHDHHFGQEGFNVLL